MLIVPDWPGSGLLAVLESRVKEGKIVLMEKWRPSLICPCKIGSNTFRGMTKFNMCVYRLNFQRDGNKIFVMEINVKYCVL